MYSDWLWPLLASLGVGVITFVISLIWIIRNDRKK